MSRNRIIRPPFFEIGPKSYLVGDEVLELALFADAASKKYDVDIIFTAPLIDIRRIVEATERIFVFAPHMDPITIGRGLADTLAESVVAAGAHGVMLNHVEKPLTLATLNRSIKRAREVGLMTIVCTDTIEEAQAVAHLRPTIIVAEPSELIGTGKPSDMDYVLASIEAVKSVNPDILVLQGAGISNGKNVYDVIIAGAEATGSSSGVVKAPNREAMVDEMIHNAREAFNKRTSK
ncbi:MAG: triose-phosphate isomerase [Sphaerochaetaceae bacterium]